MIVLGDPVDPAGHVPPAGTTDCVKASAIAGPVGVSITLAPKFASCASAGSAASKAKAEKTATLIGFLLVAEYTIESLCRRPSRFRDFRRRVTFRHQCIHRLDARH